MRVPVKSSDRINGNIPYYGANGIQDYVNGYTHEGEFVLVAEDGASDLTNYPVNYVNGKVWVNNHAHVLQGKEDKLYNKFLSFRVESMRIESWLVGGGRAKLNVDVLKKIPSNIPNLEEQKLIGNILNVIDNLIASNQRQLNKPQKSNSP